MRVFSQLEYFVMKIPSQKTHFLLKPERFQSAFLPFPGRYFYHSRIAYVFFANSVGIKHEEVFLHDFSTV